jgi:hypothetical protein
MSILGRLAKEFHKRQRAARTRVLQKAMDQRANAEADLALDDQRFHKLSNAVTVALLEKRLGMGNNSSGYKSAIGEGFEWEDDGE